MIIVSVPDRLVRDPATRRVVDDTGIEVDPTDVYWARLLADSDVKEASKAKQAKLEAAAADDGAPAADTTKPQESAS